MITSYPNIQIISSTSQLKLALLDLQDFAAFSQNTSKRDTEKQAALYGLREVLGNSGASILYKENGRPYISESSVRISISHAYDKLALLFSYNGKEVGVDIEKVRDKVLKIKEKFLSAIELKQLKDSPVEMYTLYWAVKEAVYKAADIAGLIFAEQIIVDPFQYHENGGEIIAYVKRGGQEKKFDLHYVKLDDYVLVYTANV